MKLFSDENDYPIRLPQRALRSSLFRLGLTARLGERWWQPIDQAPYLHKLHCRTVDMFSGMPVEFDDPDYEKMIGPDSKRWSRFEEQVLVVEDALVEPDRCLVIGPEGRLVRQSVPGRLLPLYPSTWRYYCRHNVRSIPEVIIYDGFSSTNYYHHFVDCLSKIVFLQSWCGLSSDIPLVINKWIYESRFFSEIRRRNESLSGLNWLVLAPGEWLNPARTYIVKAVPFDREIWRRMRSMYGQLKSPAERHIFVSRDRQINSRGLINESEVIELLAKHGFETVYMEHLTVSEQQEIWEQSEYVVSLQGMALIQQMFLEPSSGHVLELMPRNRMQSEYYWQAWTLGLRYYDVQVGSDLDKNGEYLVDCGRVEAGIQHMLNHPANAKRYGATTLADV